MVFLFLGIWVRKSHLGFSKHKKGAKTVKLQGYAPYENYFKICFSKNGPQGLYVYALPNDTVELYLSSNDKEVLWKNAYKGNYHNIVTDFEKGSRRYWIKKMNLLKIAFHITAIY